MPIKALPVRWIELAAHYAKPPWASPEYHDDALRQWYYQETSPALQSSGPHTMDSILWTAIRVLESQSLLLTSFPEPLRLHPIAKLWAWQYLDEQARTIWRLTFAVMMVLSRGTVEHPLIGLNERLCARYDTLFHWQGLRSTEGLTEATTLLQLLFHDTYLLSFEKIDSKTVERLKDAFQGAAPKPRMSTCPWYLAVPYVKALLDTGHIEDAVAVLDSIIRRDGLLTSSLMPIAESNTQSYLDSINSDHLSNDRIIEAMKCRAWGYLHAGWLGDAMIMLLGIRQMQSNQNAYDNLPRELRIIVRDKAVLPLQSLQYLNQGNHWSVMHLFADRGVGYLELLYAYQDVAVHASEDLGTITVAIKKALAFAHSRAAFWKERNSDRPVTHRDDQDVLQVQELCSHIVKVQSTTLPPGSLDRISWERNEVDVLYFNDSSGRAAQLMADMIRVHGDRSADQALPDSIIESWQDYLSEIQESQKRKSSDAARGEDEKLPREPAHGMASEQAQDKVEDSSQSSDESEIVPPLKATKSRRMRARSVQERRGVTPRGGVRRSLAGQSPPAHRRAHRAIREALVSDDSDDVASDLWSTRAQSGRHKVVTSDHRRRSRPRRPAGRPIRHETSVGNRAPSGFLEMMFGSMFSLSSGRSSTLR
ncbi:hypothetical protein B9Z65_6994 [Elsinoe australis]|uniref:Uncharacterized protein n=1 Tax=Elsinoe australis TaxID=40998 RepID=A0A2P7Z499_9PEZI|nr:hypothetical protein B9Z65_6994 [Elsinoe australis]